jgi:hypothetical protein
MNEIPTHNASGDRHLIAQEVVNPTTKKGLNENQMPYNIQLIFKDIIVKH